MRPSLPFVLLALSLPYQAGAANTSSPSQPVRWRRVAAQRTGQSLLLIESLADPRFAKKTRLTLQTSPGGRWLWQRVLDGRPNDWKLDGPVLLLAATDSWENWSALSYGVELRSGRVLWRTVGELVHRDQNFFVIQNISTNLGPYGDLNNLRLTVVNRKTGTSSRRDLTIPARPGCGDTSDFVREDVAYIASWLGPQYLYARRKDACGIFVARFDWQPAATPQPILQYENSRSPR
jgi:hypothetical protein